MFELSKIESFYPEHLRHFKRNILREYLQYKMLAAIASEEEGRKLCFMGGTAIHIIHGSSRFSEDLDFDNQGLSEKGFFTLVEVLKHHLELEGFTIEANVSFKGAFSADIKITGLLFEIGLSGHKEEKILIKVDAEAQNYKYKSQRVVISKFDVFTGISAVPLDILLAQKFYAILNRKRAVGRDFYDCMFLAGKTSPNYGYLKTKANLSGINQLKSALLKICRKLNFKQLAKDTAPLVFLPEDSAKIALFPEFINNLK